MHRGDISPVMLFFTVMTPDVLDVIDVYSTVLFGKLYSLKGHYHFIERVMTNTCSE